jgi:hypothetical protein
MFSRVFTIPIYEFFHQYFSVEKVNKFLIGQEAFFITLERLRKKKIYALSFYRSQNVLGWSKFFLSDQKFIYVLCWSQTFCARPKDEFYIVNSFFVPAQNILEWH